MRCTVRLGWTEVLVVLAVVLVLFGAKRLPALGKSLGKSLRNFKRGVSGLDDDEEDSPDDRPALAAKADGGEVPAERRPQSPGEGEKTA